MVDCLSIVAKRRLEALKDDDPEEYARVERLTCDLNSGLIPKISEDMSDNSDDEDKDEDNPEYTPLDCDIDKVANRDSWLTSVERYVTNCFMLHLSSYIVSRKIPQASDRLYEILEALNRETGMSGSVFFGGPNPAKNGQISAYT